MKVGDKVWASLGRQHKREWQEREIIGETSRSWIMGPSYHTTKLPKKGELPWGVFATREEVDRYEWVNTHAGKIADAIRCVKDYSTLQKIAELVDYEAI